ncbi:hypothetical protein ACN08Z_01115 [Rothia sp. P7181]|uniref:hypothetical protein n=1 Tax=unclassified Rothia (in: high G+C Gram-positive bacteria) TaxID=2689056 RepID=UPI003AEB529D
MVCARKVSKAQKLAEKTFAKAQKATGKKAEKLTQLAEAQAAKASEIAQKYAEKTRAKSGEVAAVAADKLSSFDIPEQAESLVEKATGNKKALKNAQKQAVKAAKAYAKEQKKATKGGNKSLVFLGLIVAGAVAGYAAYKASQPVEDPWKTPQS